MQIQLVKGDDNDITLQLKENGQPFAVALDATVRAAVINEETKDVFGPVACSSAATGADWAAGIVVIEFDTTTSETFATGDSSIEVEIQGDKKKTFIYRHAYVSEDYID